MLEIRARDISTHLDKIKTLNIEQERLRLKDLKKDIENAK